jgi:tetrahydromethanopterin S-methyltransferase subunit E
VTDLHVPRAKEFAGDGEYADEFGHTRDPPAQRGGVRGRRDGYIGVMRIGSSIGLIALGLILALAVSVNVRGIDLTLVGWILTAVGVLGLIVSLALTRRNRSIVGPSRDQYGVGADPTLPESDPRY